MHPVGEIPGSERCAVAPSRRLCQNLVMEAPLHSVKDAADGDLAERIASQSNDPSELRMLEDELFRRFLPRVRIFGRRHLRDPDRVDELCQRVLTTVLQKLRLGALREPDRIASFVFGVARMKSREIVREGYRLVSLEEEHQENKPDPASSVDQLGIKRLPDCLSRLDERQRSIVVLSYFEERNAEQLAQLWNITDTHVRVLRHRALARLRRCIEGSEAPA